MEVELYAFETEETFSGLRLKGTSYVPTRTLTGAVHPSSSNRTYLEVDHNVSYLRDRDGINWHYTSEIFIHSLPRVTAVADISLRRSQR